ncbi:SAM-dependent methyltransferase [Cereibacter sp. SYSU M97828]|nr:SAM-dependent methyltransferase [Cereibacter flavus]
MPHPDVIDHLTRLYAANDDPWNHRSSPYEAEKYAATLSCLGPGPFAEVLEIGCGNGELALRLASRCERLVAMDCIAAAVEAARSTLSSLQKVQVLMGSAPQDLPSMQPDLVVLSEVLYFLTPDEIAGLGRWLRRHAKGPIVAVNWTGPTDEPLTGSIAVELLAQELTVIKTLRHEDFRIDVFRVADQEPVFMPKLRDRGDG